MNTLVYPACTWTTRSVSQHNFWYWVWIQVRIVAPETSCRSSFSAAVVSLGPQRSLLHESNTMTEKRSSISACVGPGPMSRITAWRSDFLSKKKCDSWKRDNHFLDTGGNESTLYWVLVWYLLCRHPLSVYIMSIYYICYICCIIYFHSHLSIAHVSSIHIHQHLMFARYMLSRWNCRRANDRTIVYSSMGNNIGRYWIAPGLTYSWKT